MDVVLPGNQWCTGQCQIMKNMAKLTTNRVSTIKIPDGQYTQIGNRTLTELFRIHFPGSKLIPDSDNGQSQQNLAIC
jgi:hypothetical protein